MSLTKSLAKQLGAAAFIALGAVCAAQAQQENAAPTLRPAIAAVNWEEADQDAQALGITDARPASSRTIVAATGGRATAEGLWMPLLLPQSLIDAGRLGQLDEPLRLNAATFNYTAEAKAAPRSYLVQGTRYIFEIDDVTFEEEPTAIGDIFVERLEYGIEASFERYGVMYSITIFCADPAGDEECAEEAMVRRLASEMALIP